MIAGKGNVAFLTQLLRARIHGEQVDQRKAVLILCVKRLHLLLQRREFGSGRFIAQIDAPDRLVPHIQVVIASRRNNAHAVFEEPVKVLFVECVLADGYGELQTRLLEPLAGFFKMLVYTEAVRAEQKCVPVKTISLYHRSRLKSTGAFG